MPILDYERPFFDVYVDLCPFQLPHALASNAAISKVRLALQAMVGIGVVTVGMRESDGRAGARVQVEQASGGRLTLDTAARDRLASLVKARIRQTLSPASDIASGDGEIDPRW